MSFCISDDELDALYGLPHAAQLMYVVGIRPHMDYATGVVGLRRRISLKGLAESLYVDHVQGRNDYGAPSRDVVRNALRCLQVAGLIQPHGAAPMVFKLPHARTDNSAQNVSTTRIPHPHHGVSATEEPLNQAACAEVSTTRIPHAHHGVSTTHPVSVDIDIDKNEENRAREEKFPPTPTTKVGWAQWLIQARGFPLHIAHKAEYLAQFANWIERGVTAEHVITAIYAAEAYLGGRRPASPKFYFPQVERAIAAEQEIKNPGSVVATTPGIRKFKNADSVTASEFSGKNYLRGASTDEELDAWMRSLGDD